MTIIRRFALTTVELAVHALGDSYFVYDRDARDPKWHLHCGPYSTFD